MKSDKIMVWPMGTYWEEHWHVSIDPIDSDGSVMDLEGITLKPGWIEYEREREDTSFKDMDGTICDLEFAAYAVDTPEVCLEKISDTWVLRVEHHGPHTRIKYDPDIRDMWFPPYPTREKATV